MDLSDFQFTAVAELADGTVVIAAVHQAAPEQTTLLTRSPGADWQVAASVGRVTVALCPTPDHQGYLLCSPAGEVVEVAPTGARRVDIPTEMPIRTMVNLNGVVWAAGMDQTVFQLTVDGWRECSAPEEDHDGVRGFNALAQAAEGPIHAVGFEGAVAQLQNDTWTRYNAPTELALAALALDGEDLIAVGKSGTLLRGTPPALNAVPQEETEEDFIGVCHLNGNTFVSTPIEIFRLVGTELTLEVFADDESVATVGPLTAGPSGIWSVGGSDLLRFDGDEWVIEAQTW